MCIFCVVPLKSACSGVFLKTFCVFGSCFKMLAVNFRFFALKRKTKVICHKIQKFTQQECSAPSNIPPSPFSFYKQVTRFFLCLQFQTGSSFVYGSWHFPRFSEAAIPFYSLMSPWFLFVHNSAPPPPPPPLFCHGCPALGHTFITCRPLPLFLTVHVDPLL